MRRIGTCTSITLIGTFYADGCAIVIVTEVAWTVCVIEGSERINGARRAESGRVLASFTVIMARLTDIENIRISAIFTTTDASHQSSVRVTRSAVIGVY